MYFTTARIITACLLLFCSVIFSKSLFSQSPDYILDFAKTLHGDPVGGNENINSMVCDEDGNIYCAGTFQNSADFDPSDAYYNINSNGSEDIFIMKTDSDGNMLWAKSVGGTGSDIVNKLALDKSGNILITGYFNTSVDFDPGPGTTTLACIGFKDLFIAKYSNSGEFIWANRIGSSGETEGENIILRANNEIFITGIFSNVVDFDPGVSVSNLSSAGSYDIFMARYDSTGNYLWAKAYGGTSLERSIDATMNNSGNILITGSFNATCDFDPGAGVSNLTSIGGSDVYIACYDSTGNYIWAERIGSSAGSDQGTAITVDDLGNIYSAGYFYGLVDFDPGAGIANKSSAGIADLYVIKLNPLGNYITSIAFGSISNDKPSDIKLDASGKILLSGTSGGDFDPGGGIVNLPGSEFLAKYDEGLNFLDGIGFGSISLEGVNTLKTSIIIHNNKIVVSGLCENSSNFDIGVSDEIIECGQIDGYIAAYDNDLNFQFVKQIGRYKSIGYDDTGGPILIDNKGNIYMAGRFDNTVDFDPGSSTSILNSYGTLYPNSDIFLAKYDADGNYVWSFNLKGSGPESPVSMMFDADSNIVLLGRFYSTIDADPDTSSYILTGNDFTDNTLIAIYSRDGNFISAKNIDVSIYKLFTAKSGDIYIAGNFSGTIDMDPGPASYFLSSTGLKDAFFAKYTPDLEVIFAKSFGGSNTVSAYNFVLDSLNNIYVCGSFTGSCDFDPSPSVHTISSAGSLNDGYLSKYSPAGEFQWVLPISSSNIDNVGSVDLDTGQTAIFIAGTFSNTVDFDPSAVVSNLTSAGGSDIFIARYTLTGNYLSAVRIGGTGSDMMSKLQIGNNNKITTAGLFNTTCDFDPAASSFNLTSAGSSDIFISTYNSDLSLIYASRIGGTGYDLVSNIGFDQKNLYISGYHNLTADFDPGSGVYNLSTLATSAAGDIFFAKYFHCPITYFEDTDMDGYGNISSTLDLCDTIIPIGYTTNSSDCNDMDHLINPSAAEICNSIDDDCNGIIDDVEFIATITPTGPTTFCKPGSVVLNAPVRAGYTYQWKRNSIPISGATSFSFIASASGNYTVMIDAGLCADESEVISVLAVKNPNANITNADATNDLCFDSSIKLKTANTTGYSWQWYKGAVPISAATSNIYFATIPGNYKVKVTNSYGCSKTSPAFAIIKTCKEGLISDVYDGTSLNIFPNPASNEITVSLSESFSYFSDASILIETSSGELATKIHSEIKAGQLLETLTVTHLPEGIYYITIVTTDQTWKKEFVIIR